MAKERMIEKERMGGIRKNDARGEKIRRKRKK